MPTKIKELTPAQIARFGEWADKWVKIGLSTEPANFDLAKDAALRAYKLIGLKQPMVILRMGSPFSTNIGGTLACLVLQEIFGSSTSKSQVESQVWLQVWSQVWSQVRSQVESQVDSQVRSQVWSRVGSQVDSQVRSQVLSQVWSQIRSQVRSQVDSQVRSQVESQIESQVKSQVWSQVRSQVNSQVRSQVWSQIRSQVRSQVDSRVGSQVESQIESQVWSQVDSQVRSQVESQVRSQVESQIESKVWSQIMHNSYNGAFWASWGAFVSFFRDVAGWQNPILDRFKIEEDLIKSCGWIWWHENVLAISDRPSAINRDSDGRLHCENAPSICYRDGWSLWHIHGVPVPQYVIEKPGDITIAKIDNERNAEVRRIMIERYRYGTEVNGAIAFMQDAGGKRIDYDEKFGTLWRRDLLNDEPIVVLECTNSSPEPDGKFKKYWLRVDPACTTAHEAAAWTFDMKPNEYTPLIET